MLVTINRPKQMNSLPTAAHWEGEALFAWFDAEPSLRVAVLTGQGDKSFSAGADLIEAGRVRTGPKSHGQGGASPPGGFMGVSRRVGKKPIIAAVNGFALGGGFEICLGCDMIVASPQASFGLPEALRGLYAGAGGLSRLVRLVGLTIASEVALTGRRLSAEEALRYGIANKISKTHASVLDEAIAMAKSIGDLSPDAVIVTRHGLRQALETASVERASQLTAERYGRALSKGDNMKIGLAAFAQKKRPLWVPSKL